MSKAREIIDEQDLGAQGGQAKPLWRRWPFRVLVLLVVLAIGALVANSITLQQYALSPGLAQPVGPMISVPGRAAPRASGSVYLTDVYVTQVKALLWPYYELNGNDAVYPASALFGSGTSSAQIQEQEQLQMVASSETARVVALRRLGFTVPERTGTIVLQVVPGSPASHLANLQPGDAILALDGHRVPTPSSLTTLLGSYRPGQRVDLTVQHADGVLGSRESLTLGHDPQDRSKAFVGVQVATGPYFVLPLRVDINSDGIGGPSAGLAYTLGLLDRLTGGDLTGGVRVAATGTIALSGAVGAVGGVPQKTIAVEHAGATVFIVPKANYRDALSRAGPGLKVVPVSTLAQALGALKRLGGNVSLHLAPAQGGK